MKYITKYNENFDWDDDDFDYEEEIPANYKVFDMVEINMSKYWYNGRWETYDDHFRVRRIKEIKHTDDIKNPPKNYEGMMFQIQGASPELWFKIDDIKGLNESFDWNDDDFDFEEEEPNNWVSVPKNVILPIKTKVKIKNNPNLKHKGKIGIIIQHYKHWNKILFDTEALLYKNSYILVRQETLDSLNENFDWNDDDFDYEEDDGNFNVQYHIDNDIPIKVYKKDWDKFADICKQSDIRINNFNRYYPDKDDFMYIWLYRKTPSYAEHTSAKNHYEDWNVDKSVLFENFDFDEDDFDFEEEQPDNDIKVGDLVKLVNTEKVLLNRDNRSLPYKLIDTRNEINSKWIIQQVKKFDVFGKCFGIGSRWYLSKAFKKLNTLDESFDFNDDDFDFEEVEEIIKVGDKIIIKDNLYKKFPSWTKDIKDDIGKTIFYVHSLTRTKWYNFDCVKISRIKNAKQWSFYIPIHMAIKVNDISENFDFNDDDFDFEEVEEQTFYIVKLKTITGDIPIYYLANKITNNLVYLYSGEGYRKHLFTGVDFELKDNDKIFRDGMNRDFVYYGEWTDTTILNNDEFNNMNESFDWSDDDFDYDETPDIDPYSLKFPVKGVVNSKWIDYCNINHWDIESYPPVGQEVTIDRLKSLDYLDLNDNHKSRQCYYMSLPYPIPYDSTKVDEVWYPFDSIDIKE